MPLRLEVNPKKPFDWNYLVASLTKRIEFSDRLIELGASVPEKTKELAVLCSEVIGVELMPERIPTPPLPNVHYVIDDAQHLSTLPDSSANILVAAHLIEHLPDDIAFLKTIGRILSPQGFAIISTPNRRRLIRRVIETIRGPRSFPWWEHVREYDKSDLEHLLERIMIDEPQLIARYKGIGFGLCSGPLWLYRDIPPRRLIGMANWWIIEIEKASADD